VPGVTQLNAAPGLLRALGVTVGGDRIVAPVRGVWPSRYVGNGIGRPALMWSLELSVARPPDPPEATELQIGDLVGIADLDARFNAGYRRGWLTIGVVVHGGSPLPGHGPGVNALLSGPAERFDVTIGGSAHQGLTEAQLYGVADDQR
jgi:hypothetical protein